MTLGSARDADHHAAGGATAQSDPAAAAATRGPVAAAGAAKSAARSVLRAHDFRSLLASRTASTAASAVTWVVLPLYIYRISHSSLLAGLASAMNVIPYVVFGIVAGTLVDRSSPRRVMIVVELCNAAVLGTVPLLHFAHVLSITVLCAVGFLSATAFVWFDVASATIVPAVVGKDGVFHANGYLWSVATLITALAAPAGFFLLGSAGIGGTFAALTVFYVLSAVFLSTVRLRRIAPEAAGPRGPADGANTTGRATLEGLRFILHHPIIRLLTIIGVGSGLSAGAVYGMIVVFANQTLHLSTGDYRISWILAASSVGALLASLVAPRLRRFGAIPTVAGLLGLDTVLMTGYALSPDWPTALAAILLWNLVHTTLMIVSISFRQVLAPPRLQGRVNAAGRMLAWGSVPLGSALCGAMTGWVGSRTASLVLIAPIAVTLVLALGALARGRATIERIAAP